MTDERSTAAAAAEFALGLLTGEELRDAQKRAASDPAFAAEVARWRGRLAPLYAEAEAVSPPANLWSRIERAVAPRDAANDNLSLLRRSLVRWRSAALAAGTLAACLSLVLALEPRTIIGPPPQPPAQQPRGVPMVAMLGDKHATMVVASWDPAAQQLVLAVPGDMPSDERHSNELWVIPPGGKPSSLGTMSPGKQTHMHLADALAGLLQQGATIAISVEPRGGSPTGAPTGPVVASGALTRA